MNVIGASRQWPAKDPARDSGDVAKHVFGLRRDDKQRAAHQCPGNLNCDRQVTVDEIMKAVNAALDGPHERNQVGHHNHRVVQPGFEGDEGRGTTWHEARQRCRDREVQDNARMAASTAIRSVGARDDPLGLHSPAQCMRRVKCRTRAAMRRSCDRAVRGTPARRAASPGR